MKTNLHFLQKSIYWLIGSDVSNVAAIKHFNSASRHTDSVWTYVRVISGNLSEQTVRLLKQSWEEQTETSVSRLLLNS